MEVCIAEIKGKAVMLKIEAPLVYIDGQVEHIKGLSEEDLHAFAAEIDAIPRDGFPEGYGARVNARRVAFLARLLGMAASEESQDVVLHLLDSVHYDVLEFLGENESDA